MATVEVTDKIPVTISGVTAQNGTYNGEGHTGYTGTSYSGTYDVTCTGRNGTAYASTETKPFNASPIL